jgi:hypothetical protein
MDVRLGVNQVTSFDYDETYDADGNLTEKEVNNVSLDLNITTDTGAVIIGDFTETGLDESIGFLGSPAFIAESSFEASFKLKVDGDRDNQKVNLSGPARYGVQSDHLNVSGYMRIGILTTAIESGGSADLARTIEFQNGWSDETSLNVSSVDDAWTKVESLSSSGEIVLPYTVEGGDGLTVSGNGPYASGTVTLGGGTGETFSTIPVSMDWANALPDYAEADVKFPLNAFRRWLNGITNSGDYETAVPATDGYTLAEGLSYSEIWDTGIISGFDNLGDDVETVQGMADAIDGLTAQYDTETGRIELAAQVAHSGGTDEVGVGWDLNATVGDIENLTGTGESGDPIEVTITDHGLESGNSVLVEGVAGKVGANGTFTITRTGEDTFTLDDAECDREYGGAGTVTLSGQGKVRDISGGTVGVTPTVDLKFSYGLDSADAAASVATIGGSYAKGQIDAEFNSQPTGLNYNGIPVPVDSATLAGNIVFTHEFDAGSELLLSDLNNTGFTTSASTENDSGNQVDLDISGNASGESFGLDVDIGNILDVTTAAINADTSANVENITMGSVVGGLRSVDYFIQGGLAADAFSGACLSSAPAPPG